MGCYETLQVEDYFIIMAFWVLGPFTAACSSIMELCLSFTKYDEIMIVTTKTVHR